jgi:acyl carrier protein
LLWLVQTSAGVRCHDASFALVVEERVLAILSDKLGVDRERLTNSSSLVEDLGADSLAIVELMMEMEEEFDITIGDEDTLGLKTVGDLLDYICGRTRAQ